MTQIKVNGEAISSASIEQERQQLLNDLSLQNSGMANDRLKLMILDRAKQNVIEPNPTDPHPEANQTFASP